jgi:formylglycine-generating enzyme required for sulfatase activity
MKLTVLFFMISILTILGCSSQFNAKKTENEQINSFVSDYKVLVLDGVNIIDGTGTPVKSSMSITIENGKITAIEKQGEKKFPAKAKILKLDNKYVMPGLIEMHAHMTDSYEEILKALLSFGITTLRIPAASAEGMTMIRDKVNRGEMMGPRIFTAGELIDGPGSVAPFGTIVENEEQMRAEVHRQAKFGVNYIKLYTSLTPELVKVAIDEAHSLGLEVIGHLGYTGWTFAANNGINGLIHSSMATPLWELMPEVISPRFRDLANPTKNFNINLIKEWTEKFDINGPEMKNLTKALVDNHVVVDPTLVVMETFCYGNDLTLRDKLEPELAVPGSLLQFPMLQQHPFTLGWSDESFNAAQRAFQTSLHIVKKYYDSGVLLTTGTDAGMPWITHGVSLHRELELLVRAGIPETEVIKIATANGARALHILDVTGTIEVGKQADLIVLSDNPIENIKNTRKIELVLQKGKSIDHKRIQDSIKASIKKNAEQSSSQAETFVVGKKNALIEKPDIEFVDIPGGTFMMGSPETEEGRKDDEVQHEVTLSAFKMSKYSITRDQYELFIKATVRIMRYYRPVGSQKHPAMWVTWYDATAFAEWMGCRLPTEAEYEYAARANTTTPFYTGESLTSDQAYFNQNLTRSPMPVGSFPPNAFGLYDMHGNMVEWCSDWYGENNINDKINPKGPEKGDIKVFRGGGFWLPAANCRSACRGGDPPINRGNGLSFRLVKDE